MVIAIKCFAEYYIVCLFACMFFTLLKSIVFLTISKVKKIVIFKDFSFPEVFYLLDVIFPV